MRSLSMLTCGLMLVAAGCTRRSPAALTPATKADTELAARFPRDAARFEVQPVNDSTIAFATAEARWVQTGMIGVAVDPARGDALVGRLRVLEVRDGRAEALVTGQITRLASGHVLLLVAPHPPWWRQRSFWLGVLTGTLLTVGLTLY